MTNYSLSGPYQFRKIMLVLDNITVEAKSVITSIWSLIDEISATDASDLLQRASNADRNGGSPAKKG